MLCHWGSTRGLDMAKLIGSSLNSTHRVIPKYNTSGRSWTQKTRSSPNTTHRVTPYTQQNRSSLYTALHVIIINDISLDTAHLASSRSITHWVIHCLCRSVAGPICWSLRCLWRGVAETTCWVLHCLCKGISNLTWWSPIVYRGP
jgi:hypothetical protein